MCCLQGAHMTTWLRIKGWLKHYVILALKQEAGSGAIIIVVRTFRMLLISYSYPIHVSTE